MKRFALPLSSVAAAWVLATPVLAFADDAAPESPEARLEAGVEARVHHAAFVLTGLASYYAKSLMGHLMADGTRMDALGHYAASKTLPLGTLVKVTNLSNQKSTVVEIKDRGPNVKGRILDLSPSAALDLGMKRQGIARVQIEPVEADADLAP